MSAEQRQKCFVVMPFGTKPIPDSGGCSYDFDKVYRVIIQRAIRQAGMEPIRADEPKSAHIIHSDMFKELRDRKVVLADLSLNNPNVFYELGIRHVMSPTGTVLICRAGAELPFDVKLSRVIFYEYDGQSLDWEEAERVVGDIQLALEEAGRGSPDSPVHALLERVYSTTDSPGPGIETSSPGSPVQVEQLDLYQGLVARCWADGDAGLAPLLEEHQGSAFGIRAVGHLCLSMAGPPEEASQVARALYHHAQYDLVVDVLEKLGEARELGYHDLLRYGSAISELEPTLSGADRGLAYCHRALEMVTPPLAEEKPSLEALIDGMHCYQRYAGLLRWRWMLSQSGDDLPPAIDALEQSLECCARALAEYGSFPRRLNTAQTHLILLLLLRIRDHDTHRPDHEGHREAILRMKQRQGDAAPDVSYLRWYQAIALADAGDVEGSRRTALTAFAQDAQLMRQPDSQDIGRRQYASLRRFMEDYLHVLHNQSLIGYISQLLQSGHGGTEASSGPTVD